MNSQKVKEFYHSFLTPAILLTALVVVSQIFTGCALLFPKSPPSLQERLYNNLDSTLLPLENSGATVAVVITNMSNETLLAYNENRLMIPASIQKLAVAAHALYQLPEDFRWETRIFGTSPLDSNGILHGDLIIEGSWDPSLSGDEPCSINPWKHVYAWSEILYASGLRKINGSLGASGKTRIPGSWEIGDLKYQYAPVIAQVSWNDGLNYFSPKPVTDPRELMLEVFQQALHDNAIEVNNSFRFYNNSIPDTVINRIGLVHKSALLDSILKSALAVSSNNWTEMISSTVHDFSNNSSRYKACWKETLDSLGINTIDINAVDACGMARRNNLKASTINALLVKAWEKWGERWTNLLPHPGQINSTVETRLNHLHDRLLLKTGTMSRTRSLAGYIVTNGEPVISFCIIVNNCPVNATPVIDTFIEEMVNSFDKSPESGINHVVWR